MLDESLKVLRAQKEEATVLRNLGELEEALQILADVIIELKKLEEEKDIDPGDAAKIRAELADTWGMKGGVYRRFEDQKNNADGLAAYKRGYEIEKIDGKSTYNLTNMITLDITLGEASPSDSGMREHLQLAIEDLERKTEGERDDRN